MKIILSETLLFNQLIPSISCMPKVQNTRTVYLGPQSLLRVAESLPPELGRKVEENEERYLILEFEGYSFVCDSTIHEGFISDSTEDRSLESSVLTV